MGCTEKEKEQEKEKEKSFREEEKKFCILLSQLLVRIPPKWRAGIFPRQLLLFPPAIPHLPPSSKKGPKATRLEKDRKAQEKQVGCQRANISIQGMTSLQEATH